MSPENTDPIFGIEKLDTISTGRMEPGLLGLIYGPPGTGKTTIGSHFLFKGASQNENVCLLTYEPMTLFTRKFQRFRSYESSWLKDGYISIFMLQNLMERIGIDPYDFIDEDLDLLFDVMIQIISDMDMKRVVIDPGTPFIDLIVRHDKVAKLTDLKLDLVRLRASALIVYDIGLSTGSGHYPYHIPSPNLFDIIIRTDLDNACPAPVITLRIERWKDSAHSRNIYVLDTSGDRVIMAPRLSSPGGLE